MSNEDIMHVLLCFILQYFTNFFSLLPFLFVHFSVHMSSLVWNTSWNSAPVCRVSHSCFCAPLSPVYVSIMVHKPLPCIYLCVYIGPVLVNKFLMKFIFRLQHLTWHLALCWSRNFWLKCETIIFITFFSIPPKEYS